MTQPWKRPELAVTRPQRGFTGIYRSADDERDGETIAGVPLQTASDAVVAAVKLGYKVADAQITRGRRLARGLTGAAKRAGMRDWSDPVDAAEHLLLRTAALGLEWIEGAARRPGGSLRRLTQAQYDILGSLLGLRRRSAGDADDTAAAKRRSEAAHAERDGRHAASASVERGRRREAREPPRERWERPLGPRLVVRHERGSAKRRVRVLSVEAAGAWPAEIGEIHFHHTRQPTEPVLVGVLTGGDGAYELCVRTQLDHPAGRWCAAVCDRDGFQIGALEVEL